jgi:hypothetical protein
LELLTAIITSIIGSGLVTGATAFRVARNRAENRYAQKLEAAPGTYTKKLGEKIRSARRAVPSRTREVEVSARAIVTLRNQFARHLGGISELLDSEIDGMESILQEVELSELDEQGASQLVVLIQVLNEVWDAKADQLQTELRRIMADLGLLQEQ